MSDKEPVIPLWLRNKKADEDRSALYALKQSKEQGVASGQKELNNARVIANPESDSQKLGHSLPKAEVRKRMKDLINPDSD
jgi:hypothetical protein